MGNFALVALEAASVLMMGASMFPEQVQEKARIRIAAGAVAFEGTEERRKFGANTGGDIPHVHIYDVHGQDLGWKQGESKPNGGKNVGDGESVVREIETSGHPEYLRLLAYGKDATCVAYITMTGPSGEDYQTWNGDFAKACGAAWYPSPQGFPGANDFTPACVWISRDDRYLQAISLRMPDFRFPKSEAAVAAAEQWKKDKGLLCDAPARQSLIKEAKITDCIDFYPFNEKKAEDGTDLDPNAIKHGHKKANCKGAQPKPEPEPKGYKDNIKTSVVDTGSPAGPVMKRRSTKERRDELAARGEMCVDGLVQSNLNSHSAREVCESETSSGPDFVAVNGKERLYCDMCEHQLWDLCGEGITQDCFDLDAQKLVLSGSLAKRDEEEGLQKEYKKFAHWK
ncbi:hypothetical protein CSOJ01_07527 [Colletotrichum sojae]|uniref:Cholera enterotoxin subunit A2 n=1 Tax=Colletotrichum sojae TaxID=2175907 RepID=A0A8H6J8H8_9PEZI|nr:hypothetical protein CSOJ01_07527 [Colletotrichum sojae]